MLSRRTMLGAGTAMIGLSACGQKTAVKALRSIEKVGIQTYTLRAMMAEDFRGTFQMIKDVGYDYVELNGRNFSDTTPEDLRMLLDDIGLPAPATHISYDSISGDPGAIIEVGKTLGATYLIVPWIDAQERGSDDWKRHAEVFNRAGEVINNAGMRLAYHNHDFEFIDQGGQTGMDILLNETVADLVDFELDLFWANLASIDIPDFLKRYPGRFKLCHIKDMKGKPQTLPDGSTDYEAVGKSLMVNVGDGDTPFEDYFALNDLSGLEYFITEHDQPKPPYRDAVETSLKSVRAMRF